VGKLHIKTTLKSFLNDFTAPQTQIKSNQRKKKKKRKRKEEEKVYSLLSLFKIDVLVVYIIAVF
jgi:hypothetical protein